MLALQQGLFPLCKTGEAIGNIHLASSASGQRLVQWCCKGDLHYKVLFVDPSKLPMNHMFSFVAHACSLMLYCCW